MQQLSLDTALQASRAARVRDDEPQVLSVSDVNRAIKQILEGRFPLLWIKGEVSNFKPHSSGHWYFCLKDSKSQINMVMFKGFNQGVRFKPKDGMEVIVRGKVTVYEPRGNYQIFCELMDPVGAGALQLAFEQLKAKLLAEGLFAEGRKRALPFMPQHVAVVTSPTGAAIRDILNVLNRRFRGLRVTLIPAVVQGAQAAPQICKAIESANRLRDVDVLIVGRGGGSVEDLWCFNEESVARAIAASRIPTISAVGHEIDFTIADFVADVRAPTPSAAAELVVRSSVELHEKVGLYSRHLVQQINHALQTARRRLRTADQRLGVADPKRKLQDLVLRCDELQTRLQSVMRRLFDNEKQNLVLIRSRMGSPLALIGRQAQGVRQNQLKLENLIQLALTRWKAKLGQSSAVLDNISPLRVLDRGYAIATHNGEVVRDPSRVKPGDSLSVRVAKGNIETEVKKR